MRRTPNSLPNLPALLTLTVALALSSCGGDAAEAGVFNGPCFLDGTCNAGLLCSGGTCVDGGGTGGQGGSGGQGGAGGTGGMQAFPLCGGMDLFGPSQAFATCFDANCCTQLSACEAEADCIDCLVLQCTTSPTADAVVACADTNCGDPGDTVCGLEVTTGSEACDTCIDMNCCTEVTACFGGSTAEVDACAACLDEDPSCVAGPGQTAADNLNACFAGPCAASCS